MILEILANWFAFCLGAAMYQWFVSRQRKRLNETKDDPYWRVG